MDKTYRTSIIFEEVEVPEGYAGDYSELQWKEISKYGLMTPPTDDIILQEKLFDWLTKTVRYTAERLPVTIVLMQEQTTSTEGIR